MNGRPCELEKALVRFPAPRVGLLIFVEDFFGGGVNLDDKGFSPAGWFVANLPERWCRP